MASNRRCRECGAPFLAQRDTREFCDVSCRRDYHNRKAIRGALAFDFLMAWRFDRAAFEAAGGRTLLTQLVSVFRAEDRRERDGRHSWDNLAKAKQRHPHLFAKILSNDVAGVRKRSPR